MTAAPSVDDHRFDEVSVTRARVDVGVAAALVACLFLSACSEPSDTGSPSNSILAETPQIQQSNVGKSVAISHTFALQLDSRVVEATQQKHLAECRKLGCKVLSTRIDRWTPSRVTAMTSVRIAPDALASFIAVVSASPAEVVSHVETAEDKSVPLLDVEKRLEAKLALRDRLTAMLRESGAKTAADLIAIETELARVQGDIEAATAERDFLRSITETVKVDVHYTGISRQLGGVDFYPIERAIGGIGQTLVSSLAALISFMAALVPWSPVIVLVLWGMRRGLRRWKRRDASADQT
jgi:hypothetical protein